MDSLIRFIISLIFAGIAAIVLKWLFVDFMGLGPEPSEWEHWLLFLVLFYTIDHNLEKHHE